MHIAELVGAVFLPEDLCKEVLRVFRLHRAPAVPTFAEEQALIRHVARIRFESAALENVLEGLAVLDVLPDGATRWVLTEAGMEVARTERAALGLPPRE